MSRVLRNCMLLYFLLVPLKGHGQSQQFLQFSKDNGLCHKVISTLFIDQREVLWIGTEGNGLCRYDGQAFSTISLSRGLRGGFVENIVSDSRGNLWFLTEEGPTMHNGFAWKHLPIEMEQIQYQAIASSREGQLFLLADSLYQFDYTKEIWETFSLIDNVVRIFGSTNGIWLVAEDRISLLRDSPGVESWPLPENIHGENISDVLVIDSVLYIGLLSGGMFTLHEGEFQSIPNSDNYLVTDISASGIGSIWVATKHNGLLSFNTFDTLFIQIGGPEDLPFMELTHVVESARGQTWVSSNSQGIARYMGPKFHTIENNSADPKTIRRIVEGKDGGVVVLQVAGDVWRPGHPQNEFLNFDSLSKGHDIVDIDAGPQNDEIYLSDDGRLIIEKGNGYQQTYQFAESHEEWKMMLRDPSGQIWAASGSGLYKVGFSQLAGQLPTVEQTMIAGTKDLDIRQILIDAKMKKWVLSENQLGYVENQNYLVEPLPVTVRNPTQMALDQNGRLWLGTEFAGIFFKEIFIKDSRWKKLDSNISIQWPDIQSMLISDNKIVVSTEDEIQVFEYDQLRNLVTSWKKLGQEQGVSGLTFLPGSLVGDAESIIWAGAEEGVLQIRMGAVPDQEIPGSVYFDKILLGYDDLYETEYQADLDPWYNQNKTLSFAPHENQISFSYRTVTQPGILAHYQYRLIGATSKWTEASGSQEVQFASLASGEYQFEVRAANAEGNLKGKSTFFTFEIRPQIWERPWFLLTSVLALILLAGYLYKRRIASIKSEAEARAIKLEMEKTTMDLERKALQLQMNPHFIFNAINSIQSQIQKQDLDAARISLTKFAKLMRLVLESSRETYIHLEEEIELLENYVRVASLSQGTEIKFNVQLDERLQSEEVMIPPMMLQPFIENAIDHGFAGLRAGTIDLSVELKGRNLVVVIQDDGQGMDIVQDEGHKSLALQVIAERLSLMKRPGNFQIENRNQSGNENGTIVSLIIPLDQD